MTDANVEYDPVSLLHAQETVWEEYVGRVVLPSATIWQNMTAYLQEQPPKYFTLYHTEPKWVKTQWSIEQAVVHEGISISASIETETPASELHKPDEAGVALVRLEQADKWPDPDWPSYRRKYSIPADFLLADHPTFTRYVTSACNSLFVRLQGHSVIDRGQELLPGFVQKECSVQLTLGKQFDTRRSKESPSFFHPLLGLTHLRKELQTRIAAGQLVLPSSDPEAVRIASEQILREALPRRIGIGLRELERIRLLLIGQLQEDDQSWI